MQPREQLPAGIVQTEVLKFTPESWNKVKKDILRIEGECFGEEGYDEETFRKDFSKSSATIVLLRSSGLIIGYTYALSVNVERPLRWLERNETALVASTAITSDYQHRGLVRELIGKLEEELKGKGFKFIERDAAIANGYADSIQRHYGRRIVESHDHKSKYGPQRFFRIRL